MKHSSLIFLSLTAILQMISINTRYLLIEVSKEQESKALSRSETYACKAKPSVVQKAGLEKDKDALTCALEGYINGNHILYDITKDKNHHVLTLWNVVGDRCKPKPEKCHCKTLLQELLELNPNVNRIDGYMKANPWLFGCRCYLGEAARAGFKFIEDCDAASEERLEFTTNNYGQICEDLQKIKCRANVKIYKI